MSKMEQAQSRFDSALALVAIEFAGFLKFVNERDPHWDDEDDALHLSADKLEVAAQEIGRAHSRLKEGS